MRGTQIETGIGVINEAESVLNDSQHIVITDCHCDAELRSARHQAVFATMATLGRLTTVELSMQPETIAITIGPPDSAGVVADLLDAVRPFECPICW